MNHNYKFSHEMAVVEGTCWATYAMAKKWPKIDWDGNASFVTLYSNDLDSLEKAVIFIDAYVMGLNTGFQNANKR